MTETTVTATTAAEAAALWWAEQIGAPVHRAVAEGIGPEHPDHAFGVTTSLMSGMLSARHPVSDAQGRKFAAALTAIIADRLAAHPYLSLHVDYGPDLDLAEAAKAAGVHLSRFPIKTLVAIRPDHVTAALGYGASPRLIWSAPGWVRPVCGLNNYGDHEPLDEVCSLPVYHEGAHGEWVPDPKRCNGCGASYAAHVKASRDKWTHSWQPAEATP